MVYISEDNVSEVVRYHKPDTYQVVAHEALAAAAEAFIIVILRECKQCADTTAAIRKVREAKMTASAAIALGGLI